MKKVLTLVVMATAISCCAPNTRMGTPPPMVTKEKVDALDLSKDHFKNSISIIDDPSDKVAELNTSNGYKALNDSFLRAFINKKTGEISFQVYIIMCYEGLWRYYSSVNYEGAHELLSAKLTVFDRDMYCT